jgi:hypothetical protein
MRSPRVVIPSTARNLLFVATIACAVAPVRALRAQTGVQLQGIVDMEGWSTDTSSTFLTRNNGKTQLLGRMLMWGALEPVRGLAFYAMGEGDRTVDSSEHYAALEQIGVRITPSSHLIIDAGRFPHVVGAFSARRFSTRNPLVGEPDIYPTEYPNGVKVGGVARWLDYRAALVDLPVVHPGYTPDPTRAWRPAAAVGITPYVGLRFGLSYTEGSYLNKDDPGNASLARDWSSYKQRVLGSELVASVGYLELNAELTRPSYDSPNGGRVEGLEYYMEGKYTFTPRLFAAARLERNDYPFIENFGFGWVTTRTDFHDQEIGAGYRLTASTLLKASYRWDKWHVNAGNAFFVRPGGRALAVQLSQAFDVIETIDRIRNGAR